MCIINRFVKLSIVGATQPHAIAYCTHNDGPLQLSTKMHVIVYLRQPKPTDRQFKNALQYNLMWIR